MADAWTHYIWPLIVIVAQSVLLLVVLLIITAYVLYADRKIWAAVQIRRGPNVVGPWGLLQSFAVDPVADPEGDLSAHPRVVDVADRGMVEPPQGFSLAHEPDAGGGVNSSGFER